MTGCVRSSSGSSPFSITRRQIRPRSAATASQRLGLEQDLAPVDDRHPAAQLRHVLDDVRREDHDGVLADLAEQVQEAHALGGIEAGGGLVDDDQRRVAEQRDGDAEALAHAAGVAAELLLAHVVEVRLAQQRLDDLAARPPRR